MKIIAINASPRKGWNTELLVQEAAKVAAENGAEIEYIDLYHLEKFTGCISCFGCKMEPNIGKCVCRDGLAETLEKIRKADALILGSPLYFGDLTASFRALYERLMFQYLTYKAEIGCYNQKMIPVLLLASGNATKEQYTQYAMDAKLDNYKNMLSDFAGPTTVIFAADTLQVNDYSKYQWTAFDPEAKQKSRRDQFPEDLRKAYEAGKRLTR